MEGHAMHCCHLVSTFMNKPVQRFSSVPKVVYQTCTVCNSHAITPTVIISKVVIFLSCLTKRIVRTVTHQISIQNKRLIMV